MRPEFLRAVITKVLLDCFTDEYLDWIFSSGVEMENLVDAIIVELIKYAYDNTQEKYPLRHFIPYTADGDSSERMMYNRVIKIVQEYRDREYKIRLEQLGEGIEELKGKSMASMADRKKGYSFTEMQFYEMTAIHDRPICEALFKRRIVDVNKIQNKRFEELIADYETWIDSMESGSKASDDRMVFYSLAFFTIEWKYAIELSYAIADYVIEAELELPSPDNYRILCADLADYKSVYAEHVFTHSRMVKERLQMLPYLIKPSNADPDELDYDKRCFAELLSIQSIANCCLTVNGVPLREWFVASTSLPDWAAFFKDYNVFSIRGKKQLTPEKIRYMRRIFDSIFIK